MIRIVKYCNESKKEWDTFVQSSRTDTFLFYRDYMDYHSYKFDDSSFLFYKRDKLIAIMPGNIENNVFFSHKGLTYGGLVLSKSIGVTDVFEIYNTLLNYLKNIGINEIVIKLLPYIYFNIPSQEEIYFLFNNNALKISCSISSVLYKNSRINFTESRKSGLRKAKKNNINVEETSDFNSFWIILENNLKNNYNTKPVHSIDEIIYLKNKFPNNIKLYSANLNNEMIAGTVVYVMNNVVRVQYISANSIGKELGAIDIIFDELINESLKKVDFFDFGQSTENDGYYLNKNLIFQKEGFGGRGVVFETYKLML